MDLRAGALLLLLAAGMAAPAAAQQFVTDNATITPHRACQLEGWYGEAAAWVLPACRFVRPLEITAGVGFVADEGGGRAAAGVPARPAHHPASGVPPADPSYGGHGAAGAAGAGWAVGLAWTPPPLF